MTIEEAPLFDFAPIFNNCQETTLRKGIALADSGKVRKLKISGETVTAEVKGTEFYLVQLNGGDNLSGYCTCPAAEYQPFCKHTVAVAMCVDQASDEHDVDDERELIRQHLQDQSEDAVLDMLLDYLEHDDHAWRTMLTTISVAESSVSYAELKKLVTQSLPRQQIWDWREVGDYFYLAENQLKIVFDAMQSLSSEQQWKLIHYVVERLNSVLEHIDDSNGERFGIEGLINTQMPKVFAKLKWGETEKAQWMFERMTCYEFDVYPSIEDHFSEVWQVNDDFYQLCQEAIDSAPKDDSYDWNLHIWARPLIQKSSDWREIMAIKQKIARRYDDYLNIVNLYLENDEPFDAEFWLAKAKKLASGVYEQKRCNEAQFQLYVSLGEISSAWKLGNQMLVESPSFSAYQRLNTFKQYHSVSDDEFLNRVEQNFINAYHPPSGYGYVSDREDALVEFYIDQHQWDKACDWVATRKVSSEILLKLADNIVNTKPYETLSYYMRVVTTHIERTKNEAYTEALKLLQRVELYLKPHPNPLKDFYLQVTSLAQTYKRKRNMLKLLQQSYAEYV